MVPRCVECHKLASGADILHPGHHDFGSLLTVDVMLSRPAVDFEGGAFLTKENSGAVRSHAFERGDGNDEALLDKLPRSLLSEHATVTRAATSGLRSSACAP